MKHLMAVVLATTLTCAESVAVAQTLNTDQVAGSTDGYLDRQNGLRVEDAVRTALEREPLLRVTQAELDAARAMQTQAALRPNPSLSFDQKEQHRGGDRQTSIGVEWPLDLFRKGPRVALAAREVETARLSVADRQRLLAAEVRLQYGRAAAAVRQLAIAENAALSAARELSLVARRVEEGAATPLDRDLLEVSVRRLEAELSAANSRTGAEFFELKRLMGVDVAMALKLGQTIDDLVAASNATAPSSASAIPAVPAIKDRSDVREAAARVQVADARLDRARSEGRFDMSVVGSFMRMDASFPQAGIGANGQLQPIQGIFNYVTAGVMTTLPIRNRNQGEIGAVQAERVAAAARLESVERVAQAELAAAIVANSQLHRAAGSLAAAVQLARRNLDVIRQTYELGRMTLLDVLAEQRQYLDLERAYSEALQAAYGASVELQRARGEQP